MRKKKIKKIEKRYESEVLKIIQGFFKKVKKKNRAQFNSCSG